MKLRRVSGGMLTFLFVFCPGVWSAPMPAVGPMKPYKTPPRAEWRMPNGIRVVMVEDRRVPMVVALLAFRAGTAAVGPKDAGLVQAMTELLTDGTAKHNSRQIADLADQYGGTIEVSADADSIVLESYCLSEFSSRMFELMAEVARTPSFPASEVALRKKNMQEELNLARAEPDFLAGVAFYKKLFRSHPYAFIAPTDASIARLGRERIVKACRRMLTPRNAVMVLVGDVSAAQAQTLLRRHFGSWQGGSGPQTLPAVPTNEGRRRIYLVDRPKSVQVSLALGNLAIREDHPDYFNLLLANQVLGGSFGSRLVQDIRESKGFTYRIGSHIEPRLTTAVFKVRTPVRNEVVEPVLDGILEHLERLRDKQVAPEELDKAKNYLAGRFVRQFETQEGLARAVLHVKLHRLSEDFLDTFVDKVRAVESAGVLRAATTFIRPEELTIVAVGDAAKIKDSLSRFSSESVVPLDQDGN